MHLRSYYEVENANSTSPTFSSEKLKFEGAQLEIEEVEYGTYHIIASMGNILNNIDQTIVISLAEMKEEMRYFANAFIDFAKSKDLDNDYYLYVEYPGYQQIQYVYDYEIDILYIPDKYDQYCEMYALFGTTRTYELEKTEKGINWLVQNGFGKIKHNEYESIYTFNYPAVYLDDDGNFKSYNLTNKYSG